MATYKNLRKVLNLPTLSESPSSGVNGEMYFNTTDSALHIYDGVWKKVTQSDFPGPDWTVAAQQAKLVASDAQASDEFGNSIAISGDTVVVGAYIEDTGATSAGAAYVFTRSGTTWSQQAKIQGSTTVIYDNFGMSVAIDSNTIIVGSTGKDTGASSAGAAYIFTRSGTTWSQQALLTASDPQSNDQFGYSVSISSDTVVVGANNEDTGGTDAGAAYVFTRSGTSWSQQAKIVAANAGENDNFGISVDIDGDNVIVGAIKEDTKAADGGAVYVFTRSGTTWSQQKLLTASDVPAYKRFGHAVAIDGKTAVGTSEKVDSGAGAAYAFLAG